MLERWFLSVALVGYGGAALVAVASAGCSGGGPAETYRVSGTVKLASGQPLSGGQILFRPIAESPYVARGDILEDGSFELTTFQPRDGAIAGKHRVMITPEVPEELQENAQAMLRWKPQVDVRYQSTRTSPLEYVVADDGTPNRFEIVLEPPKQ